MKKTFKNLLFVSALIVLLVMCFTFSASASTEYTEGHYTYTVSNGKATIRNVAWTISGDVIVPDTLGGYPVTSIGSRAINFCNNITSLTIPDSVTYIGDWAFHDCNNLTSITIPDSVTYIGDRPFDFCPNLASITVDENNKYFSSDSNGVLFNKDKTVLIRYPVGNTSATYKISYSVTSIDNAAFFDCDNLTSITIPDSVVSIGDYAFCNCDDLTSITIPDSVTSIGYDAFHYCNKLTGITVDENNEYYSNDSNGVLFNKDKTELVAYSTGITSATYIIPDSVISISEPGFSHCNNLTSITIGNNVTSICSAAFAYCDNLDKIYYCGTEEQWNKIFSWSTNATIYYNYCPINTPNIHNYTSVVTPPTCTENGYTTYSCSCGYSYVSDYEEAKSHNYTSSMTRPSTHLSEGVRTYTCTACGDSYPEALAKIKEHTYTPTTTVAPTCEQKGHTVYVCECGDSYYGDVKSATGHDYEGDTCKICGESKTENCKCNCHKSGIAGFFWKILRFFYKLIGTNKTCACGVAHY